MNTYSLAIIGLVFTTFIWGITFELVEESLKSLPPAIFSAIRFLIAAFCILLVLLLKNKKINITKDEFISGLICGIFLSIGYFFQSYGLWENTLYFQSDPNKSAFITGTSVLMVPIIMLIMGKKNQTIHLWISIFIVLLGLLILLNPNVEKLTIGDILTFGCAISFATHIIYQGRYLIKKIKNIYNFFFVQMSVTALIFLFVSFFEKQFLYQFLVDDPKWSQTVLIGLLVTGILATFVAILIMVWAQKIVSPVQTAMIFTLEPVFAGFFNHFYTEHTLSNWGIFSGLIIVLGIIYHEYMINMEAK